MAWIFVLVAGLCEIGWAAALKYSDGFSRLVPSALTIAFMAASMAFIALALRDLPMGTVYAVWTGIGAVGTVVFGIVILGEPATALRIGSIALILAGITGLKLVG